MCQQNQNEIFLMGFFRNFCFSSSTEGSVLCDFRCFFYFSLSIYCLSCSYYTSDPFSSNSFYFRFYSCFFFLTSSFFSLSSFSLRKYSPVSILMSSILGVGSGGKGVYSFFSLGALCFFLFILTCLNLGRYLSQFSSFIFSSFMSSRLTISSLMWQMGWMFCMVSMMILRSTLMFLKLPMILTVLPCTRMQHSVSSQSALRVSPLGPINLCRRFTNLYLLRTSELILMTSQKMPSSMSLSACWKGTLLEMSLMTSLALMMEQGSQVFLVVLTAMEPSSRLSSNLMPNSMSFFLTMPWHS